MSTSPKQQTFIIRRDPTLFLETRKYHRRSMKRLFLKHYEPLPTKHNKEWTSNLGSSIMNDLRVHLTWVIGMNVFKLSDRKVGKKVLRLYKKSGELKFLTNVVIQKNYPK